MSDYGIVEDPHRRGNYWAKVPLVKKGKDKKKYFSKGKWNNTRQAAILWQDREGRKEWGAARWAVILATKSVRKMRSESFGVHLSLVHCDGKWPSWRVEWRDVRDISKRTVKQFGAKAYGSLEAAEVAANEFANQLRAKRLQERPITHAEFEFEE